MRILLIEDDVALCESLAFQIRREGFEVDLCHDGEDGLDYIKQQAHDLILLDRMLPLLDGLQVLRKMRELNISTPVILVTALGELHDRIDGLDCGADDYIVKPFEFAELMARIRCIFRRPQRWESSELVAYGDLKYDAAAKKISCAGSSRSLSKRESDLFEMFLRNGGQTLPRTTLLARVWGPNAGVEEGNLDNYIHFLRRHLGALNSRLKLKTVRGVGYCMEDPNV